jgi:hypothetical protein
VTQSLTCSQLHKKAERIACLLIEKVTTGETRGVNIKFLNLFAK